MTRSVRGRRWYVSVSRGARASFKKQHLLNKNRVQELVQTGVSALTLEVSKRQEKILYSVIEK